MQERILNTGVLVGPGVKCHVYELALSGTPTLVGITIEFKSGMHS